MRRAPARRDVRPGLRPRQAPARIRRTKRSTQASRWRMRKACARAPSARRAPLLPAVAKDARRGPHRMRLIVSFAALFLAVALVQLGSGALAPLDALSGAAAGFSTAEIGLLGSAHFVGFFVGCWPFNAES